MDAPTRLGSDHKNSGEFTEVRPTRLNPPEAFSNAQTVVASKVALADVEAVKSQDEKNQSVMIAKKIATGLIDKMFSLCPPTQSDIELPLCKFLIKYTIHYLQIRELDLHVNPSLSLFRICSILKENSFIPLKDLQFLLKDLSSGLKKEDCDVLTNIGILSRLGVIQECKLSTLYDCSKINLCKETTQKLTEQNVYTHIKERICQLNDILRIPPQKTTVRDWLCCILLEFILDGALDYEPFETFRKTYLCIVHKIYYFHNKKDKNVKDYADYYQYMCEQFDVLRAAFPLNLESLNDLELICRADELHDTTIYDIYKETDVNVHCSPVNFFSYMRMVAFTYSWSKEKICYGVEEKVINILKRVNEYSKHSKKFCSNPLYFELRKRFPHFLYLNFLAQQDIDNLQQFSKISQHLKALEIELNNTSALLLQASATFDQDVCKVEERYSLHQCIATVQSLEVDKIIKEIVILIREITFRNICSIVYFKKIIEIVRDPEHRSVEDVSNKIQSDKVLMDLQQRLQEDTIDEFFAASVVDLLNDKEIIKLLNVANLLHSNSLGYNGVVNYLMYSLERASSIFDEQLVISDDPHGIVEIIDIHTPLKFRKETLKTKSTYDQIPPTSMQLSLTSGSDANFIPIECSDLTDARLEKILAFEELLTGNKKKIDHEVVARYINLIPATAFILQQHFYSHYAKINSEHKLSIEVVQRYRKDQKDVFLLLTHSLVSFGIMLKNIMNNEVYNSLSQIPSLIATIHLLNEQIQHVCRSITHDCLGTHRNLTLYCTTSVWSDFSTPLKCHIIESDVAFLFSRHPHSLVSHNGLAKNKLLKVVVNALNLCDEDPQHAKLNTEDQNPLFNSLIVSSLQYLANKPEDDASKGQKNKKIKDIIDSRLKSILKPNPSASVKKQFQKIHITLNNLMNHFITQWELFQLHVAPVIGENGQKLFEAFSHFFELSREWVNSVPQSTPKLNAEPILPYDSRVAIVQARVDIHRALATINSFLESMSLNKSYPFDPLKLLCDVKAHFERIDRHLLMLETTNTYLEALTLIKELFNLQWILESLYQCQYILKFNKPLWTHNHSFKAFQEKLKRESHYDVLLDKTLNGFNFGERADYFYPTESNPNKIKEAHSSAYEKLDKDILTSSELFRIIHMFIPGLEAAQELLGQTLNCFKQK